MANIICRNNQLQALIDNGKKMKFIKVPTSIIEDLNMNSERVAIFCYLCSNVGMNNNIMLSLPDLYDFLNRKWNRHVYEDWDKNPVKFILDSFRDIGFVEYLTENNELMCSTKLIPIRFYKDYIIECNENYFQTNQFAKIYLDELEIIMSKENCKYTESVNAKTGEPIMESHTVISLSELLLVFAWLRTKIHINNEKDSFGDKKAEALNCYLKDIAKAIKVDKDDMSALIALLVKLNLIYCDYGDYVPNIDNTKPKQIEHIIAYTYKRVEGETIYSGKNYYLSQVEKKKNELKEIRARTKKKTKIGKKNKIIKL